MGKKHWENNFIGKTVVTVISGALAAGKCIYFL